MIDLNVDFDLLDNINFQDFHEESGVVINLISLTYHYNFALVMILLLLLHHSFLNLKDGLDTLDLNHFQNEMFSYDHITFEEDKEVLMLANTILSYKVHNFVSLLHDFKVLFNRTEETPRLVIQMTH